MISLFLLDTCILSEPLRPQPDSGVLAFLAANEGKMAISSVIWHELQYGTERLLDGRRKERLRAYLREMVAPRFPVLPYDTGSAVRHAFIRAELERQGRAIPFADGQIAATALVHGLVLVIRNTRDFEGIPGLRVMNPFAGG